MKTSVLISLALLATVAIASASNGKCTVLALAGGGDKGAFQAGAFKWMVKNLDKSTLKYDKVSGISVGALNAAAIGMFDIGKEEEAAEYAVSVWRSICSKNVYSMWSWGGFVRGLMWMTGLVNNDPLKKMVDDLITQPKREVHVGAVNMETGDFDNFNSTMDFVTYKRAVIASTAVPFVFPSSTDIFKGYHYQDGGVMYGTDVFVLVNACRDEGYADKDIVVDIILCGGDEFDKVDAKGFTSTKVLIRYLQIASYYSSMNTIERVLFAYKDVQFRHMVRVLDSLPNGLIPLNFDPAQIELMITRGKEDAEKQLNMGEGVNFKYSLEHYRLMKLGLYKGSYTEFLQKKLAGKI